MIAFQRSCAHPLMVEKKIKIYRVIKYGKILLQSIGLFKKKRVLLRILIVSKTLSQKTKQNKNKNKQNSLGLFDIRV